MRTSAFMWISLAVLPTTAALAPHPTTTFSRRAVLSSAACAAVVRPAPSAAYEGYYELRAARNTVTKLLEDETAVRKMVTIGIATTALEPPQFSFKMFQRLETKVADPDTFMSAAIEYIEYSRDASDLFALAKLGRSNGAGPIAIADYLDRAMAAARGADKALEQLVPLLPTP